MSQNKGHNERNICWCYSFFNLSINNCQLLFNFQLLFLSSKFSFYSQSTQIREKKYDITVNVLNVSLYFNYHDKHCTGAMLNEYLI